MFVVISSACTGKTRRRTARVLDGYLQRMGPDAWFGPVTKNGLRTVFLELRKKATRATSVSCWRNHGTHNLVLCWRVGRRLRQEFDEGFRAGITRTNTRMRTMDKKSGILITDSWKLPLYQLAGLSGLLHDLGKFNLFFQKKLRPRGKGSVPRVKDPMRHEWVSLLLLNYLLNSAHVFLARAAPEHRSLQGWIFAEFGAVMDGKFLDEFWSGLWEKALLSSDKSFGPDDFMAHGLISFDVSTGSKLAADFNRPNNAFSLPGMARFLVASHHKLFGRKDSLNPTAAGHVRPVSDDWFEVKKPYEGQAHSGYPDKKSFKKILSAVYRLVALHLASGSGMSPEKLYWLWRARAIVARAGLILADHHVSSLHFSKHASVKEKHRFGFFDGSGGTDKRPECISYANTNKNEMPSCASKNVGRTERRLNQPLSWHMEQVARMSPIFVARILDFSNGEIDGKVVSSVYENEIRRKLSRLAIKPQFEWQNIAARVVDEARVKNKKMPMLLFMMAETGSGKTRACARLMASASIGSRVRFSTLLNLRSLTVQTGQAYEKELGLGAKDMAVVIGGAGCTTVGEVNLSKEKARIHDDEVDPGFENIEVLSEELQENYLPNWLDSFLCRTPGLKKILASPVSVSTVDYLIQAAEPARQQRHILPMLRVASADLVLDEIDGYDPSAFVAIARLVQMAALWGRNVIVSSATIPFDMAKIIYESYSSGAKMRTLLHEKSDGGEFLTGFVDNYVCDKKDFMPFVGCISDMSALEAKYVERSLEISRILSDRNKESANRIFGVFRPQMGIAREDWFSAIAKNIGELHSNHHEEVLSEGTPKRISFGLIRVANIKSAIALADFLTKLNFTTSSCGDGEHPLRAVFCAYHSRLFKVHRAYIEENLDLVLKRSVGSPLSYSENKEMASLVEILRENSVFDLTAVIIATPVEEIGRDHDFDWCIAEPSSTHSLVQTAGRVRRHRGAISKVDGKPNFLIMDNNFRFINDAEVHKKHPVGKKKRAESPAVHFVWPGYEKKVYGGGKAAGTSTHPHKNMKDVLPPGDFSLDARLCVEIAAENNQVSYKCKFMDYDMTSFRDELRVDRKSLFSFIEKEQQSWFSWQVAGVYNRRQLRSSPGYSEREKWCGDVSVFSEDGNIKLFAKEVVSLVSSDFVPSNDVIEFAWTPSQMKMTWLCPSHEELLRRMEGRVSVETSFEFEVPVYFDNQGSLIKVKPYKVLYHPCFGMDRLKEDDVLKEDV